jgi:hypothetical protein
VARDLKVISPVGKAILVVRGLDTKATPMAGERQWLKGRREGTDNGLIPYRWEFYCLLLMHNLVEGCGKSRYQPMASSQLAR